MIQTFIAWFLAACSGLIYVILVFAYFARYQRRRKEVIPVIQGSEKARTFYAKRSSDPAKGRPNGVLEASELRGGNYAWPIALTALTTFFFVTLGFIRVGIDLHLGEQFTSPVQRIPSTLFLGFIGAYLWGIYECLVRFRIHNWTANSQYFIWVRLLIGACVGPLAAAITDEHFKPLVACGIGAFPAETIRKWMLATVGARLTLPGEQGIAMRPSWSTIEGVNHELVERLAEIDVLSPTHLSCADPLTVYTRTNIAWKVVLDLIDQAILVQYVDEKIALLRPLGIRGAIEMAVLSSRRPADAAAIFQDAADAMGVDAPAVRNLSANLVEDPQVNLIWELWFEKRPPFGADKAA